ncbi:hypothetical protein EAH_00065980 [Eimeria acervulina]|uniref:Uncharacterized protein n=1 Tax=Eimeria acervulina TaxID=5801 RepID=U6GRX9_EIMAC|nr:hypothetical protein EAH_00065980 [Eimeria acervulina]CDI82332.1 hypothetical protein EAH_00065980 [Eimeria acervulina]
MPVHELTSDIQHASSLEAAAGASAAVFQAENAEQVKTDLKKAPLKRRSEELFDEEGWGKLLILEVPLDDGTLQPASPLDPALDALIDTLLIGSEDPFAESAWLSVGAHDIFEIIDLSVGSRPATSAAASGLDGRAPSSNMHERPPKPPRAPGIPRRSRRPRTNDIKKPSPGASTPQNVPSGSAADAAAGTSGLDGRASSSSVHERPPKPPQAPGIPRRSRRPGTDGKQKPSPGASTPQNVPSGSAADAAGDSGLDGSRPSSNVRENPSKRRPVPIILRRGRMQRIGDEQEPSPGPSTPQNISDGSAEVALGASCLDGRAPSRTVHGAPSMPSPATGTRRRERKQTFNVKQEPPPSPPTPPVMPGDSVAEHLV